mmetsp:Transcript_10751/g.66322  ORF Transcript_10751/g.66322 Transcript_10751/m.66322 type:complete len:95 (+) Transcript_10751:1210-1494(+)
MQVAKFMVWDTLKAYATDPLLHELRKTTVQPVGKYHLLIWDPLAGEDQGIRARGSGISLVNLERSILHHCGCKFASSEHGQQGRTLERYVSHPR